MNGTRQRLLWEYAFVLSVVLFGLGCFILSTYRLDWAKVRDVIRSVTFYPWVPLAMGSYLAGQLLRGLRCKWLVKQYAYLNLSSAANIVAAGYAVNNILPGRLGEFARIGLLTQRAGLPFPQALTVVGMERVLDGIVLAFLALLATAILPASRAYLPSLKGIIVLFITLAGILTILVLCPTPLLSFVNRTSGRVSATLQREAISFAQSVNNALSCLRSGPRVVAFCTISLLIWLMESLMFFFLMPSFGWPSQLAAAVMVMAFTNLILLIPSTPGFIGPFHLACVGALAFIGVPRNDAFGYATLAHLSFFVPMTIWGGGVLFTSGLALRNTLDVRYKASRQGLYIVPEDSISLPAVPVSTAPSYDKRPTRNFVALVEAFLPLDFVPLREDERGAAIESCVHFVHAQVLALPPRLRLLLRIGLTGFQFITLLVFLRPLHKLEPAARARWVMWWAFGPLSLARQMLKAIRANAFLAFFENPAVINGLDTISAKSTTPNPKTFGDPLQ